jgi:hypothetical protein
MGSLSNYLENSLLSHVFNAAYTPPATIYLALCTADPTDAGTGASMNEVANSGSYARTAITFDAAASRQVVQAAAVVFPQLTGSLGTASHWAVVDSATHGAGNMLAHGAFAVPKSLVSGNTPTVSDGTVIIPFSAGKISTYLAHKLLDLAFRNTAYSKPDTYVGLVTTTSSDTAAGTEVSGGSYARVQVNENGGGAPEWSVAAAGALSNDDDIAFPTASASWGTVVGVIVSDASTAGNMLCYDNGMADQAVGDGDDVTFPAGDLDVTLD